MAVPATVMYFTAYDHFRDYLIKHSISSKEIAPVVAGATARGKRMQKYCYFYQKEFA